MPTQRNTDSVDPFGPIWKLQQMKLLLLWDGSIWQSFWLEWIIASGIYIAVIAIYANLPTSFVQSDLFQGFSQTILNLQSTFRTSIGFMLGFYTSLIMTRWWSVRMEIKGITGNVTQFSIKLAYMVFDEDFFRKRSMATQNIKPDPKKLDGLPSVPDLSPGETPKNTDALEHQGTYSLPTDESSHLDAMALRRVIHKWTCATFAMVVGRLYHRGKGKFANYQTLIEMGMLTEVEVGCLSRLDGTVAWKVPLAWVMKLLNDLRRGDPERFGLDNFALEDLADIIANIRGSVGGLEAYKSTPFPLAYSQLVSFCVRGYLFVLTVGAGSGLAGKGLSTGAYFASIEFAMSYFLYVGWLTVADAMSNPFRKWAGEFPWESYVEKTYQSGLTVLDEANYLALQPESFYKGLGDRGDDNYVISQSMSKKTWKDHRIMCLGA